MAPKKPVKSSKTEPDNSRNEYIPSFISKAPFYVADDAAAGDGPSSTSDYLEHQRLQKSEASAADRDRWYDRGKKLGPAATKFRKGACDNCGAMTHKTKECLSRPRKQGAKWTGRDINADEVVQDVRLGWDAKRDRWNGYDAREYEKVVDEFNALEGMKHALKRDGPRRLPENGEAEGADNDGDGEEREGGEGEEEGQGRGEGDVGNDDDARYEEEADMGRHQSTSTRNLRIREDTAKYLLNLDLDSAKYDPKTRSMVDAGTTADAAAALVAEEGFMRASGDAAEFKEAQRYAWETHERDDDNKIHLQANPTSGEFLRRKERDEGEARRLLQRTALLDRYGGQDHLAKNPLRGAAVTESERFVEYDDKGLIKGGGGARARQAKSQYAEDVLINNHRAVWGSWWRNFQWGYACCHSTVKNSYCTGHEGIRALEETDRLAGLAEGMVESGETDEQVDKETQGNGEEADARSNRKRTLAQRRDSTPDVGMDEPLKRRALAADAMVS